MRGIPALSLAAAVLTLLGGATAVVGGFLLDAGAGLLVLGVFAVYVASVLDSAS